MNPSELSVLLVGNYPPDRQESMLRFASMMENGLVSSGLSVSSVAPSSRFLGTRSSVSGLGKWLAYLDKFVLFPRTLRRRVERLPASCIVHVCDHSNAMYATTLANRKTVVTCHDLLAVRGALGDDVDCPASRMGKVLQKWILRSLGRSGAVICDSRATENDFKKLLPNYRGRLGTILLGQNGIFAPLPVAESVRRLSAIPQLNGSTPFILHVGSGLSRKNRETVLRTFARVHQHWPGLLVFAGGPLTGEQQRLVETLGLGHRVVSVTSVADPVLEALYNRAFALFFPSTSEGFGWPVIEAQACGCPVMTSDRTSLPEVAGPGALVRDPKDEAGYAEDIRSLCDASKRDAVVHAGFVNAQRFGTARMIEEYIAAYRVLLTS